MAALNANEAALFQAMVLNMEEKPNVKWDAVAEQVGYKSGTVAKQRFSQIMKKISNANKNGAPAKIVKRPNGDGPSKAAKRTNAAPKRKADAKKAAVSTAPEESSNDEDAENATKEEVDEKDKKIKDEDTYPEDD